MHERGDVFERAEERIRILKPHPVLVHPAARPIHVKGENLRKPQYHVVIIVAKEFPHASVET